MQNYVQIVKTVNNYPFCYEKKANTKLRKKPLTFILILDFVRKYLKTFQNNLIPGMLHSF